MSAKTSAKAVVVKREEKEGLLRRFIAGQLERRAASGSDRAGPAAVRVIARSISSPVVNAVGILSAEIATTGVTVDLLLGLAPTQADLGRLTDLLGVPCRIRCATNVRLLDAHEQLLIGPAATWIGDSMRRDPVQRDAFETYSEECVETAGFARIAFERLWSISKPAAIECHGTEDVDVVVAAAQAAANGSTAVVGTRH